MTSGKRKYIIEKMEEMSWIRRDYTSITEEKRFFLLKKNNSFKAQNKKKMKNEFSENEMVGRFLCSCWNRKKMKKGGLGHRITHLEKKKVMFFFFF